MAIFKGSLGVPDERSRDEDHQRGKGQRDQGKDFLKLWLFLNRIGCHHDLLEPPLIETALRAPPSPSEGNRDSDTFFALALAP